MSSIGIADGSDCNSIHGSPALRLFGLLLRPVLAVFQGPTTFPYGIECVLGLNYWGTGDSRAMIRGGDTPARRSRGSEIERLGMYCESIDLVIYSRLIPNFSGSYPGL